MKLARARCKECISAVFAEMQALNPSSTTPTMCRQLLHRATSAGRSSVGSSNQGNNFDFQEGSAEVVADATVLQYDGFDHFVSVVRQIAPQVNTTEDVSRMINGIGWLHRPNLSSQERVQNVLSVLLAQGEQIHSNGQHFDPAQLCRLTLGLALARKEAPPNWLRLELDKIVGDGLLEPKELARLLEAWSRWGLVAEARDRDFLSNVFEKMYDLIDRFQPLDVTITLEAMARLKMPRGFLVRRLVQIVETSPSYFSPGQLSLYLQSLADLHSLSISNADSVLDVLLPRVHASTPISSHVKSSKVSSVMLGQILYSLGCIQHPMSPDRIARIAALLIHRLPHHGSSDLVKQWNERYAGAVVRAAWALCALEVIEANDVLQQLLQMLLSRPPPKSRVLIRMTKEVLVDVRLNWRAFDLTAAPMTKEWKLALQAAPCAPPPGSVREVLETDYDDIKFVFSSNFWLIFRFISNWLSWRPRRRGQRNGLWQIGIRKVRWGRIHVILLARMIVIHRLNLQSTLKLWEIHQTFSDIGTSQEVMLKNNFLKDSNLDFLISLLIFNQIHMHFTFFFFHRFVFS